MITKTYFALSDIHSSDISFQDFLDKGFDPHNENHEIVLLGDYWDRRKGNAFKVVQLIRKLQSEYPTRSHILLGNHDIMLLNVLYNLRQGEYNYWEVMNLYENGGRSTMRELVGSPFVNLDSPAKQKRIKLMIELIESFDTYYETEKIIFTHAYIDEHRDVDTWDRDFFHNYTRLDKFVVIGHTPHQYLNNAYIENGFAINKTIDNGVINIDDGTGKNIIKIEVEENA